MLDSSLTFRSGLRVGILGGGQLSRMLCESAIRLGLRPIVYCQSPTDSAALSTPFLHTGSLDDSKALSSFFQSIDIAVFENEFVDEALIDRVRGRIPIVPELSVLSNLRDKLKQKRLFTELGLSTAPFVSYDGGEVNRWVKEVLSRFGGSAVFKWGRLGYDGKGVLVTSDFEEATRYSCGAIEGGISLFAEPVIDFEKELALVSVASHDGSVGSYPLVISLQERGVCRVVKGPAVYLGVSVAMQEAAEAIACALVRKIGIVGVFAIEFFQCGNGLWINEVAPRVHNSGHVTQDASLTSQFENHWRAVLGLPIGCVDPRDPAGAFAMLNILGPSDLPAGLEGARALLPIPTASVHLHWYDKAIRKGRKLGHLNGCTSDVRDLPSLLSEMNRVVNEWEVKLRAEV